MSHRALYDQQIAFLEAGDLAGLMNHYHQDAVLVSFEQIIEGKAALELFFANYLQHISPFKLISTDNYTETADAIFFEATVSAAGNQVRVYDVFMLSQGKITHHFTGILATP